MGGNESKEEGTGMWEGLKKSQSGEDLKGAAHKLFTVCKDWDKFADTISAMEIRTYFASNPDNYFMLVSYVILLLVVIGGGERIDNKLFE